MTFAYNIRLVTTFDKLFEKYGEERAQELILDWFSLLSGTGLISVSDWFDHAKELPLPVRPVQYSKAYKEFMSHNVMNSGFMSFDSVMYYLNHHADERLYIRDKEIADLSKLSDAGITRLMKDVFADCETNVLGLKTFVFTEEYSGEWGDLYEEEYRVSLTDKGIVNLNDDTLILFSELKTKLMSFVNHNAYHKTKYTPRNEKTDLQDVAKRFVKSLVE